MMNYLKEAAELIEALRREHHEQQAQQLQQAIDEGSTGGEICMGLRWKLQQQLAVGMELSDLTERRARKLLADIDALLASS
jgi:hypothetical protein